MSRVDPERNPLWCRLVETGRNTRLKGKRVRFKEQVYYDGCTRGVQYVEGIVIRNLINPLDPFVDVRVVDPGRLNFFERKIGDVIKNVSVACLEIVADTRPPKSARRLVSAPAESLKRRIRR